MAPYRCPCLEQSFTCLILSPCQSRLVFLAFLVTCLFVPSHPLLFKVWKPCPQLSQVAVLGGIPKETLLEKPGFRASRPCDSAVHGPCRSACIWGGGSHSSK